MSKKSKKQEVVEEEMLITENDVVETPVEEVTEDIPVEKKAKKKNPALALTIIKALLYVLTFPVIIIVSLLICVKMGSGASYYSFWPYVPAIIAAVFGLIFMIVGIVVYRKKSKRTIMQKTASLLICCFCLTGVFGLLMDVVFPDFIANLTSNTLFLEDVYNDYEEQGEYMKGLSRHYIRLNMLNGNYDGELSYEELSKKAIPEGYTKAEYVDTDILNSYYDYLEMTPEAVQKKIDGLEGREKELFDFTYQNYVLYDFDYALKAGQERQAYGLALLDKLMPTYTKLCDEGVKTSGLGAIATKGNEKMSWLFNKSYASMNQDGYLALDDDCGLGYATAPDNRMSVGIIIRLILNERYEVTQVQLDTAGEKESYEALKMYQDGKELTVKKGEIEDNSNEGYLVYSYNPEVMAAYEAAVATEDQYGVTVDGELKKSAEPFLYENKLYYVYNDGHVEASVDWCVLDMLGDPMVLTENSLNLGSIGVLFSNPKKFLTDMDMGGLSSLLVPLINRVLGGADTLLNESIPELVVNIADGQKLYLKVFIDDNGCLGIDLVPSAVEVGMLGYQYMSWMQLGNLLLTVCGVMSLRNLLYIFGAVSLVLIFAVGVINETIAKKKAAAKAEEESTPDEEPVLDEEPAIEETAIEA